MATIAQIVGMECNTLDRERMTDREFAKLCSVAIHVGYNEMGHEILDRVKFGKTKKTYQKVESRKSRIGIATRKIDEIPAIVEQYAKLAEQCEPIEKPIPARKGNRMNLLANQLAFCQAFNLLDD